MSQRLHRTPEKAKSSPRRQKKGKKWEVFGNGLASTGPQGLESGLNALREKILSERQGKEKLRVRNPPTPMTSFLIPSGTVDGAPAMNPSDFDLAFLHAVLNDISNVPVFDSCEGDISTLRVGMEIDPPFMRENLGGLASKRQWAWMWDDPEQPDKLFVHEWKGVSPLEHSTRLNDTEKEHENSLASTDFEDKRKIDELPLTPLLDLTETDHGDYVDVKREPIDVFDFNELDQVLNGLTCMMHHAEFPQTPQDSLKFATTSVKHVKGDLGRAARIVDEEIEFVTEELLRLYAADGDAEIFAQIRIKCDNYIEDLEKNSHEELLKFRETGLWFKNS
ncbi:hypothetical protein BJ742DRAFT_768668 [Cladochytrium replicatum]|nr:hypothetical protein BJ742DRAFT_768668 [Cladochytrium replicatum]